MVNRMIQTGFYEKLRSVSTGVVRRCFCGEAELELGCARVEDSIRPV